MSRLHGEDATRRLTLKAAVAWAGCGSTIGSAWAADNAPAPGQGTDEPPLPKLSPEAVHYQASPHDWQKCVFCSYFKEPDTCRLLSAPVSRNGWCDKFLLLHE